MKFMRTWLLLLAFFGLSVLLVTPAASEEQTQPAETAPKDKRLLILPFPFFNDTIGIGVGAAIVAEGYVQPQMLTVASFLGTTEGTYLGFVMVRNYQVPFFKRLILDPQISSGKFQDIKSYTRNAPGFENERPGSNDSSQDNYFKADGTDFWFDFKMKFLLPIGHGKDAIFPKITLDDGVFVSGDTGGKVWNPLTSGRTYLEITPFYRSQELDDAQKTLQKTAGLDIALHYDNTDFRSNPSGGSYQRLFYSWDPGEIDSSRPWEVIGFEAAKYFSLGPSASARQRVVSLYLWTVDCLSWDKYDIEDGQVVYQRPPTYKGANLGGLFRLKGYPATRFHDRAAIYYTAEYRYTLNWNPLEDITLNGRLDVDWLQLVGFAELGRVAPSWSLGTLHEDMKATVGAGLRIMANKIIVRFDFGVSEEEGILQLFIGQPF
jgi:hypothetical protein